MGFSIQVTGVDGVAATLRSRADAFAGKVANTMQGAGIDCQALAKQAAPVRKGRLRASIQYVRTGPYSCKVGTNVRYARPVEFGHRTRLGTGKHKRRRRKTGVVFVPPRPFMTPAYVQTVTSIKAEIKALKV